MDITRNWRLKTSRSQLLATRDPETGAIMLPQQTPLSKNLNIYKYNLDPMHELNPSITIYREQEIAAKAAR